MRSRAPAAGRRSAIASGARHVVVDEEPRRTLFGQPASAAFAALLDVGFFRPCCTQRQARLVGAQRPVRVSAGHHQTPA